MTGTNFEFSDCLCQSRLWETSHGARHNRARGSHAVRGAFGGLREEVQARHGNQAVLTWQGETQVRGVHPLPQR